MIKAHFHDFDSFDGDQFELIDADLPEDAELVLVEALNEAKIEGTPGYWSFEVVQVKEAVEFIDDVLGYGLKDGEMAELWPQVDSIRTVVETAPTTTVFARELRKLIEEWK
jgi:hypothetical protein